MQIANAPVSWGVTESVEFPQEYPYSRVLDEIAEAGYLGTELGPYGFLPNVAATLCGELERRHLTLCSAFVAFPLGNTTALPSGLSHVNRTASLISQSGCRLLILSDEVCAERSAVAGRREEANRRSWTELEWPAAQQAIHEVTERCGRLHLKVAFHHHVGTHVETPEEIDRLCSLFPPEELGLCLDTGHCLYGGGNPMALLERYADRLRCVHLKDVDVAHLDQTRCEKLDFYAAVRQGVFTRLGEGSIDFRAVLAELQDNEFDGWTVVEQDVLAGGRGAVTPLANATAGRQFLRELGY